MKRKDLRKKMNLRDYAHLPLAQRSWLEDTAYIQDFNRTVKVMFERVEGGWRDVMRKVHGSPAREFLSAYMYPVHPGNYGHANAASEYLSTSINTIHGIRGTRQNNPQINLSVCANRARQAADRAVTKAQGKTTGNAQPTIRCSTNDAPRVVPQDKGGLAYISVNWIRSVEKEGIGVLQWGAGDKPDLVLVVKAKHNPSVFLAEMGVKCFEVQGMRLGIKAYEVNGYAFTVAINDKRHSIFSEDFRRGVTQIQNLIAEAFSEAMKVQ